MSVRIKPNSKCFFRQTRHFNQNGLTFESLLERIHIHEYELQSTHLL